MFRLLGFLIGSAASVAAILIVTGVPRFHLEDPAIDQKRFDEAVEKLMARRVETPAVTDEPSNDLSAIDEADLEQTVVAQTAVSETPDSSTSLEVLDEPEPVDASFEFVEPGIVPPPLNEMQWYSFWNPFRSEIAASGFVSRLEKVTGLDYRVVKVKTGVYEVAFAYADDGERRTKLSMISMATGLELPDS
jgi:hypothetical protein